MESKTSRSSGVCDYLEYLYGYMIRRCMVMRGRRHKGRYWKTIV